MLQAACQRARAALRAGRPVGAVVDVAPEPAMIVALAASGGTTATCPNASADYDGAGKGAPRVLRALRSDAEAAAASTGGLAPGAVRGICP